MSDGLGVECTPSLRDRNGSIEFLGTMLIEQAQQATRGSTEVAAMQSHVTEKVGGVGAGGIEPITTTILTCLALFVGKPLQVSLALDLFAGVPRSAMVGNLDVAVEYSHLGIGCNQGERLSDERVRN